MRPGPDRNRAIAAMSSGELAPADGDASVSRACSSSVMLTPRLWARACMLLTRENRSTVTPGQMAFDVDVVPSQLIGSDHGSSTGPAPLLAA